MSDSEVTDRMNFKNIMVTVKQNAIDLTNKEFVQFIVTELSKSFMLKDSKGNMPVLSDSRVSEWISNNRLPPSLKTIFSLSDFPETLSYLADDFFYDFSEKINGEKLSKELEIVFESNHEFET